MSEIELYRHALKEANDWLLAGEGVDLCYYIDDTKDKKIVRQLLDNIYLEPKQREALDAHVKGSNAFWGKVIIAALIVIVVCILTMPTG
jgi:hypothetical protein